MGEHKQNIVRTLMLSFVVLSGLFFSRVILPNLFPWKSVNNPTGGFCCQMPSEPESNLTFLKLSESVKLPVHQLKCDSGGADYRVEWADFPANAVLTTASERKALSEWEQRLVSSLSGKIIQEADVHRIAGASGVDIQGRYLQIDCPQGRLVGMIFLRDGGGGLMVGDSTLSQQPIRVWQVSVTSKEAPATANRFLNSFQLL